MIALDNSYVGSSVRADASRGYPTRYVRLVLGEASKWRNGELVPGEQTVHNMTAATARKLSRVLAAEARIIEQAAKR